MPDDLYSEDIVDWSERQSALLRRAAAGERVNELDWPNIIEEIEDVGGSATRAVRSLLRKAIEHLLKLHGWPDSTAVEHWRGETRGFLSDAEAEVTPSMRHKLDLDQVYRRARDGVSADTVNGRPPASLPATNPFTLDDLLAETADLDRLLGQLRAADGDAG